MNPDHIVCTIDGVKRIATQKEEEGFAVPFTAEPGLYAPELGGKHVTLFKTIVPMRIQVRRFVWKQADAVT